jgi:hypothetical protein
LFRGRNFKPVDRLTADLGVLSSSAVSLQQGGVCYGLCDR